MFRRVLAALILMLPMACTQAQQPAAAAPSIPREGVDYAVLSPAQPTYGQGKIEVAEVFSYRCIHCAHFQPLVNAWKKKLPADVRYAYVPAVFGGTWDTFARAYFAAETMGVQPRTHDGVFKAVFIDNKITDGSLEQIADWYGTQSVDRNIFLSTMQSFAVNAKLNRAKQFALRTGVTGTPTIIVAGKYRVMASADRDLAYMLTTTDYLLARERALGKH